MILPTYLLIGMKKDTLPNIHRTKKKCQKICKNNKKFLKNKQKNMPPILEERTAIILKEEQDQESFGNEITGLDRQQT